MLRTIGLFGITLVSYYDYSRNVTWGYIFGTLILVLDAFINSITREKVKSINLIYPLCMVALFSFYIIFSSFMGSKHNGYAMLWQRSAFLLFVFAMIYCLNEYNKSGLKILVKPLAIILSVHLFFFYLQLILVGIFSLDVDFIEPITGETQRIFGGSFDVGLFSQFVRPSGLFAEPGTYANMIFIIFLFHEILRTAGEKYSIGDTKNLILVSATILSFVLSFSVFAFLFVLVFSLSVVMKSKSRQKAIILLSILLVPLLGVVSVYLNQRIALGDASGSGFRYDATTIFLDNLDFMNAAVGWGFLSDFTYSYVDITFNDLGLLFNIILQSGLFGLLIWFSFFTKVRFLSAPEIALALALQLTKFTITYPVIWMAIVIIAIRNHEMALHLKWLKILSKQSSGQNVRAYSPGENARA